MRQIKVLILRPGEDMVGHLTHIGTNLNDFHAIVGGFIEHITLRPGWGLYINDNGKYLGLPLNETASALYKLSRPSTTDYIVGPAILCGMNEEGDDTDVPAHVISWMEQVGRVETERSSDGTANKSDPDIH